MIFDLSNNTTIDEMGAKTISIHTTGHEKTNFTVVLTYMANWTKFPLIMIFKLKKILKGNFLPEVIVCANPIGWINKNEMLYWIENVWIKHAILSNPQSLLVLDLFLAHIVDSIKKHFCEKNTNIAIILRELTSHLQSLDVSVNKSFKAKIRITDFIKYLFYLFNFKLYL